MKKILIVLIILISLTGGFVAGYFMNFNSSDANNNEVGNNAEVKQETDKTENLDITDELVQDLYHQTAFIGSCYDKYANIELTNKMFEQEKFELTSLSNVDRVSILLAYIHSKYDNIPMCRTADDATALVLSKNEVNTYLQKLFGKSFNADNVIQETKLIAGYYHVLKDNGNYRFASGNCGGCGTGGQPGMHRKLIGATKFNDRIELEEKVAFSKARYDSYSARFLDDYYTSLNSAQVVETSPSEINWNLYNSYKYTYKLEAGNYILTSLELVK